MCVPLFAAIPALFTAVGAATGITASGLATAGTIASAGLSAYGAYSAGVAQQEQYKRQAEQQRTQAELQNRQATIEQQSGQFQQRRKQEQMEAFSGRQINMTAASGFTSSGSPTDVIMDSRREGELDAAAVRYGTDLKASNLYYGADVSRRNAGNLDQAAKTAGRTAIIGGITPLINDKLYTRLGTLF